jgi:NAD(P)-dependent dehydrogenase (short-subunit alcohol dehydrogenase family)
MLGAVEQTTLAEARAALDTNVLANVVVLRATLPALRASKGRIVHLSSFMGRWRTVVRSSPAKTLHRSGVGLSRHAAGGAQ